MRQDTLLLIMHQGIASSCVPDKPVSPKKSLNIAIAFILGLMVSVFVVFFAEYWKSTSVKVENK